MEKKRLYLFLYLIPGLLLVSGFTFLATEAHWVFELVSWVGYVIAFALIFFSLLLFLMNRSILTKLNNNQQIRRFLSRSFKSIAVLSVIFMSYMSYISILTFSSSHYNTGPVLTWNTNQDPKTEITVMWRTRNMADSIVSYGTESDHLDKEATGTSQVEWHVVLLNNLIANTTYYYSVSGLGEKIDEFTTAPSSNTNFSFVAFSDPRQNDGQLVYSFRPNIIQYIATTMKKLNIPPAFTLCCGDMTGEAVNIVTWKSWFDDLSSSGLGSSSAVQVAIGNHERHGNGDGSIFGRYYPYTYRPYYYYSFNYSYVHVTTLDPFNESTGWWGKIDRKQLEWLEQDLINAQGMKYRIIALHLEPMLNGQEMDDLRPLLDLCDKYNVNAVFYGHTHHLEVTKRNNTTYFMIGVGGNFEAIQAGFARIDVTPISMNVGLHWTNGTYQSLSQIMA